jgi:hypothetical protein
MISAEDNALRGARSSEVKDSGRVRKGAFMPRKDGQDRDGLSVSIETPVLATSHRAKYETSGHRTCLVQVRSVRAVPVVPSLDVKEDADEDDPAHALIVGIPDPTLGSENLRQAEFVAGELAKRARPYLWP